MEPAKKVAQYCLSGYTGAATVVDTIEDSSGRVRVAVNTPDGSIETRARLTYPMADHLRPGDNVILVPDPSDEFYIIGLLSGKPAAGGKRNICLSDGSYASLDETDAGERLCFFSGKNSLVFEYDAATGTARISSDAKNISFQAPKGSMTFEAADNVRFAGDRIELAGRSGVALSVGRVFESLKTALSLKPAQVQIASPNLRVSTRRADCFAEEVRSHVKNMSSRMGHVRLVAEKLETAAGSIMEKAKNVYRSTEHLSQHRAGRIRMLIDSSFHLKSRTSVLKSSESVKVDAENINLG